MKIYRNNILEPVNSVQRKPESIIIPPFYFKGRLKTGKSGYWPCNYRMAIDAASVTMTEPGTTMASFAILKDNIFEKNVSVGICLVDADKTEGVFSLSDRLSGALEFSPYDRLYVASFADSRHLNATIQIYAHRIN